MLHRLYVVKITRHDTLYTGLSHTIGTQQSIKLYYLFNKKIKRYFKLKFIKYLATVRAGELTL